MSDKKKPRKASAAAYDDEEHQNFVKYLIEYLINNPSFPNSNAEFDDFWKYVNEEVVKGSNRTAVSCCTSMTAWLERLIGQWEDATEKIELNPIRRICLLASGIFSALEKSKNQPVINHLQETRELLSIVKRFESFQFQAICVGLIYGVRPKKVKASKGAKETPGTPEENAASTSKITRIAEDTKKLKGKKISQGKEKPPTKSEKEHASSPTIALVPQIIVKIENTNIRDDKK